MKELAYDLIIEFLKTEDEADAAYYIRGVNDMLKVAEAECDNDDNDDESEAENEEPESEGESDDGSHGCEAVDVDAGESEDGPEYYDKDEYETTTKVTKQGVRVKTSNIDLGHLASLRSKGMTYKSIGDRLGIAPSTVCTLYKKYLSQFE